MNLKKRQVFFFEYCEIFTEHLRWLFLGLKYIKVVHKFIFILSWKIEKCLNCLVNIYFNIIIKVWDCIVKAVGVVILKFATICDLSNKAHGVTIILLFMCPFFCYGAVLGKSETLRFICCLGENMCFYN